MRHPLVSTVGSYLQPGGEREWKVDRENISALSAIFFLKWLRATAENHAGSAVHSQSQGWGRTRLFLSATPQMPPLAASLQSHEPARHHQICSQTSTRAGQEGESRRKFCSVGAQHCGKQKNQTARSADSSGRSAARAVARQMSAAVMLPVTHGGYGPAVRRQAEEEGGQRQYNVSAVTV